MRAIYVLVNRADVYDVLGPFETLELAQQFRNENKEHLEDYAACRLRSPILWVNGILALS